MYSSSMAGLGASMNTYNGPVPPGVPNPYTVMLHSYPTRYHGPIYTRPEFGLEWAERPNDFALRNGFMGLGGEGDVTRYRDGLFLSDIYRSEQAIQESCSKDMEGLPAEEAKACTIVRTHGARVARVTLAIGLAAGALGMHLYMRRR
jgi:hypothetical protein